MIASYQLSLFLETSSCYDEMRMKCVIFCFCLHACIKRLISKSLVVCLEMLFKIFERCFLRLEGSAIEITFFKFKAFFSFHDCIISISLFLETRRKLISKNPSARSLELLEKRKEFSLSRPLDSHCLQLSNSFRIGKVVVIVGNEACGVRMGLSRIRRHFDFSLLFG